MYVASNRKNRRVVVKTMHLHFLLESKVIFLIFLFLHFQRRKAIQTLKVYFTNKEKKYLALADSEGGGRDVRSLLKTKNKKINGEERKQRERREVQSLRFKLS